MQMDLETLTGAIEQFVDNDISTHVVEDELVMQRSELIIVTKIIWALDGNQLKSMEPNDNKKRSQHIVFILQQKKITTHRVHFTCPFLLLFS